MKSKFLVAFAIASLGAFSAPTFAGDAAAASAERIYRLKGGGTLYVFKDGKTAMEDQFGRPVHLKVGQPVETTEGQKIAITSNEVGRLGIKILEGHQD